MATSSEGKQKLPITGEVGSEGGSYADANVQVATFNEDVGQTAEAAEPGQVTTSKEDVIRYPNEKPD